MRKAFVMTFDLTQLAGNDIISSLMIYDDKNTNHLIYYAIELYN